MAPHQQVTIRRLPEGDRHPGVIHKVEGTLLYVRTEAARGGASLASCTLVELESPQTLYLGEVQARQDDIIVVNVEHTVDRATLESIQQVWRGPQGE